jgi:hypothetical protein
MVDFAYSRYSYSRLRIELAAVPVVFRYPSRQPTFANALPSERDVLLDLRSAAVERNGRPRRPGRSRSISRPSDRSTEPASGLGPFGSRSLRQEHQRAYGTPASITQTIRTGATISLACCTVAAASTYIRSSANGSNQILHTRGSSAPRWMGLVSRTADKANPASSVTHPSRLRA